MWGSNLLGKRPQSKIADPLLHYNQEGSKLVVLFDILNDFLNDLD